RSAEASGKPVVAPPALHEYRSLRSASRAAASRLRVGTDGQGSRCPGSAGRAPGGDRPMSACGLTVRRLAPDDRERWDAFVRACPDATFFHLSAWADLLERELGHRAWYLYAERGGEIVAVLPLAQVRSLLFGHALVSLPFCAYGGFAGEAAAAPLLEARADELAAELGVEYLELRNLSARHEDWPRQTLYATFRKEILDDDEANLKAIPRKQRAMVRKGIKHGLCAEIDEDVTRFFRLYSDNVRRHGTPALPRRFFAALRERFGDDCEILTVTAPDGR